MAKKKKLQVPPEPKKCPKCGGTTDTFNKCTQCGRLWTPKLTAEERAEIEQHEIRKATRKAKPKPEPVKKGSEESEFKQWEVLPTDHETEIVRKRALMRLESRKIYNQMGLSMRAHDYQKGVLMAFARLWDLLSDEEKDALRPTVKSLNQVMNQLIAVGRTKVALAARMEKAVEKAFRDSQQARRRAAQRQRTATTEPIKPGEDTEGLSVPEPVALDPALLFEQAKENLERLDEARADKRQRRKKT